MKVCFKCGKTKTLDDFYKHPAMKDGRVNKCKECNKKDVAENYANKREHYSQYEKKRAKRPERKEKAVEYQRKNRAKNKLEYYARNITTSAIKNGRLIKKPCEECGCLITEAHHQDYYKPLDVVWLCRIHHLERHGKRPYIFNAIDK